MSFVSILLPAIKTKGTTYDTLVSTFIQLQIHTCETQLGLRGTELELFRLTPVKPGENCEGEIAIRVLNSAMSLPQIEQIIREKDHYKEMLQKSCEALKTYLKELQKMQKIFDTDGGEAKVKSEKGSKKLEEENERLKQMLRTQVVGYEELRNEAKQTVENLRKEFDAFVKVCLPRLSGVQELGVNEEKVGSAEGIEEHPAEAPKVVRTIPKLKL